MTDISSITKSHFILISKLKIMREKEEEKDKNEKGKNGKGRI
jgi:hypothetical protein